MKVVNKKSNILFLPKICKDDLNIDNIIESKFAVGVKSGKLISYDHIPGIFYDLKVWRIECQSSNTVCWECGRIPSIPVFIPTEIVEIGDKKGFRTFGKFCLFAEAQNFINEKMDPVGKSNFEKLLRALYFEFYGRRVNVIFPTKNKYQLEIFAGNKGNSFAVYDAENADSNHYS